MPASGMILCCMGIVIRILGMPRILDGVDIVCIVAGVGCIIGGVAGMIAVVRSVVARRIRALMVFFMMTMVGAQRHSEQGECGKRKQGGGNFGGYKMCFHTKSQTQGAESYSND